MLSIVTPETMRALERAVMDDGIPESELIQRAASGIAAYIDRNIQSDTGRPRSLLALAGPGNNGVDTLAAAALLVERGWQVSALLVGCNDLDSIPGSGEALAQIELIDKIPAVDVILDGIFGNSGRTDLPSDVVDTLELVAQSRDIDPGPVIVAVDCPTGTDAESGEVAESIVSADITLCISNPKIGMLRGPAIEHIGELITLDIGLRSEELDSEVRASMVDAGYVRSMLVRRSATAHKSQIGGLLIVGGAPGYYGAPRLAGEAALRAGCGYVGMAVPRSISGTIASAVPELIFHPISDADGRRSASSVREVLTESTRYNALVIGPGLGRDEVATDLLAELFESRVAGHEAEAAESLFGIPRRIEVAGDADDADISGYPLVLDADALNWISEQDDWPALLEGRTCVLTPHVGEMARLLDLTTEEVAADPWNVARQAASDWKQVVVLKGPITCVASPDETVLVAPRPTPELATPGTGDVLSGLIGACIAQGNSAIEAAAISIYVGALAGKVARQRFGTRSVVARDAIAAVPDVLRRLESPALFRLAES